MSVGAPRQNGDWGQGKRQKARCTCREISRDLRKGSVTHDITGCPVHDADH